MARDFIKIDQGLSTQKYAGELIAAINAQRDAALKWERVADLMSHMHDGSNFADVELYFGLPAGTGQGAVNIATGVVAANGAAAVQIVTGGRVG